MKTFTPLWFVLLFFINNVHAQSTTRCEPDTMYSNAGFVCRTERNTNMDSFFSDVAPNAVLPSIPNRGYESESRSLENTYQQLIQQERELQQMRLNAERTQRERQLHIQRLNATLPEWQTAYFQQVDKNAKVPSGVKRCNYRNDGGLMISGQLYNGFNIDIPSNANCHPTYQVSKSGQYRPPTR